jgi:hypothetical protein
MPRPATGTRLSATFSIARCEFTAAAYTTRENGMESADLIIDC